jgi:subtilisin family serine protease
MWRNPGEISGNGLDDDGNGYVDDVHGIDAISGSGNPQDLNGHGTHVAGTIGATGDNSIGVVGVNWETSILALRFLDAEGGGTLADAIEALNYLLDLKERGVNVRVVNASWGGGGYSEPFKRVLDQLNSHGILFVAAAGNESNDNDLRPAYPSSYEVANVLSVAALTEQQNLAGFSNYGANRVDLAAPGDDILSTVPGGYASYSGTSMATPHVTGAIALLYQVKPDLTIQQVRDLITKTSQDLGQQGMDDSFGHGRMQINATFEQIGGELLDSGPVDEDLDGQLEFDW